MSSAEPLDFLVRLSTYPSGRCTRFYVICAQLQREGTGSIERIEFDKRPRIYFGKERSCVEFSWNVRFRCLDRKSPFLIAASGTQRSLKFPGSRISACSNSLVATT